MGDAGSGGHDEIAVEFVDLSVTIDDVVLLAPVSAALPAGSALVVTGANGAGKSTLLRVLAGSRKPSTGSAQIAGARIADRDGAFRRRVATMIGLPPMALDLTVLDHLTLVAATWVDDPARAKQSALKVLDDFELTALQSRFPHELSSGQTQLVGLALVLVRPFEVAILDEPEQRLDPDRLRLVINALTARRADGATLVIATHSPILTEALADQHLRLEAA